MKKKIIIATLSVSLLIGGGQVYADRVLNTNILGIISSGFKSLESNFSQDMDKDLVKVTNTYKNKIKDHVNQKVDSSVNSIKVHQKGELQRVDSEMKRQYEILVNEADKEIDKESSNVKSSLTNKANIAIQNGKINMEKDLEDALKAKLEDKNNTNTSIKNNNNNQGQNNNQSKVNGQNNNQ